jgi:hypothetical protein
MRLFGWTWVQWAIAAGRYGQPESVTFESALELKKRWTLQNAAQPGEVTLLGIECPRDHEFACNLVALCARGAAFGI